MTRKTRNLTLLCLLLSTFLLAAQQDSCTQKLFSFAKNINKFKNLISQEKVYLHFDNTGYYIGETIWFKSYVVGAENHASSELSKILYVELMSPEGYVVESRKLKIEQGQCHGEFLLKDSLYAGYYEIRAYTAYMLNFRDDCIFSRVFPVYDKPRNEGDYTVRTMRERPRSYVFVEPKKKAAEKILVTFFPEGGNLVQGLSSKVAFKAVNELGENLEISGNVCDSKGLEVATFHTTHQGAGYFMVLPDGSKYSVKVQYKGQDQTFDLSKALPKGYVMSINNLPEDSIQVQIEKSQDLSTQPLGLTVSCRGKGFLFQAIKMPPKEPFRLKIPKVNLPSGVNQITLYNSDGEIISERLVFIKHPDELKFSILSAPINKGYQPFEPIDLQFQLNDASGSPVETNFSLAVRDESTEDITPDAGTIRTNLLLSSDLKGFVENPSYYFESDDNMHNQKLDLLLMTQGWRRYSWKKSTGVDWISLKHPVEKELTIDGFVKSGTEQYVKIEKDVRISATILTDSISIQDSSLTIENGSFHFPVKDFQGKATLVLRATRNGKHKDFFIPLNRFTPPASRAYSYNETVVPTYTFAEIDTLFKASGIKGISLPEVSVKAKKKQRYRLNYARPMLTLDFQQEFDRYYDKGIREIIERNYKGFLPYLDLIIDQSKKTGARGELIYKVNHGLYQWSETDNENGYVSGYSNMPPPEKTETIDLYLELKSRDVSKHTEEEEFEVILSFNTYKNDFSRPKNKPGLRYTTLQGYSNVKEFYSPQYSTKPLPTEKDFRRTLYWNPDVRTDSSGKATVHFYNNGTCKVMKISAETVTENGITGFCNE